MSTTYLSIDIGSTQICALIARKDELDNLKILGVGTSKSFGLKKGIITNIDQASSSIKKAVDDAKRMAGQHYEQVLVSISGAYTKSVDSSGIVNIPELDIGIKEINRAMQMADHNANIPNEYEKLHILPYTFKVDDQESIEDPLGMNGSRLEVLVHIITVQKSALNNLKKAVKSAGVKITNIVLAGYASSIAVLNSDEKELGVGVIDMGGATCNIIIHSGNSIRYNDFLGVGSFNITSDLSMALHTPIPAAENIKLKYGSLESTANELIQLPVLGDENATHEVSLDIVSNVLYARVEETLMILAKTIEDSDFKEHMGAGLVLTGGFTKLKGIRNLATAIFDNIPIRLAKPRKIEGVFEDAYDPSFSAAVGLIMYGAGAFTPYEIDSNKKMRHKDEVLRPKATQNIAKDDTNEELNNLLAIDDDNSETPREKLANIADESKKERSDGAFKRLINRLSHIF